MKAEFQKGRILLKKTAQLRNLIYSGNLEFIMEAHSALSAKIVEEAGFRGIWGSGLSISAALGVRDNNEASWTQVLDALEFMSDATNIPILLDGDTGDGNFNNARRLVKKLEQRKIAGVCIEDKLFPKNNSFIKGEAQLLAPIDEFCGKVKAMKDAQTDEDFVIVARVEAFIAGRGLREALRRAEAYMEAGTDAILMHSKRKDISEIEAFIKEWDRRLPVIIVPTKYYTVPTDKFRSLGINLAIWANHNLRTSISAMQKLTKQIYQEQSLVHVEDTVAPLEEVFRLQGVSELSEAEKKYLPSAKRMANCIILSRTARTPMLTRQIDELNLNGIKDICLVQDAANEIDSLNIQTIKNDSSDKTGEVYSLYLARDKIMENTLFSNSEIIYKPYILKELQNDSNDITIIVDADFQMENRKYIKGVWLNAKAFEDLQKTGDVK
jgi:phosphoenolpyruvate phosphomutase